MWRPVEIGDVAAERKLSFRRAGRVRVVALTIGRPVKGPERLDPWWCCVRVGAPFDEFFAIAGEDSLQALVLALAFLDDTLPSLARRRQGQLEWLGENERLIVADTRARTAMWRAITNMIDGLAVATAHLEQVPDPPRALLEQLRKLVATGGGAGISKRSTSPPPRRKQRTRRA
ncbi:MAG TPA: hypothetical protein VFF06_04760 [Polyangia bacterium]|nr:hypothetical protein [Polyangia bacterium]